MNEMKEKSMVYLCREQIMGSIRRHKHAMSALLAEYRDKSAELEYQEYLEELQLNKKR